MFLTVSRYKALHLEHKKNNALALNLEQKPNITLLTLVHEHKHTYCLANEDEYLHWC